MKLFALAVNRLTHTRKLVVAGAAAVALAVGLAGSAQAAGLTSWAQSIMVPSNQTMCVGLGGGYVQVLADPAKGEKVRFSGTAWFSGETKPVSGEFYFNYNRAKVAASSDPAPVWDYVWTPVKKDPHVQMCFRNSTTGTAARANVTLGFEVIK